MNVENILRVADAIEQHSIPDLGFNMGIYGGAADSYVPDMSGHNCGTVACIAGWADKVLTGREPDPESRHHAEILLGVYGHAAAELFVPDEWHTNNITPTKVVAVLRHFAATGYIDWANA